MIKVPKREMGQRVYNAGQYMLSEIDKKVQERIAQGDIPEEILEDLKKIDEDLRSLIFKYNAWFLFSDFIQLIVDEMGLQNLLSSAKSLTKSPFDEVKIYDESIDVDTI